MYQKVSVLIPTYNRPKYFEEALKSVLNQTYKNIEIVVCDNSTNQETQQLVEYYQKISKFSIKYHKNEVNIGFANNLRKCFELVDGEYINYLMDDDLFHPKKIEKMMRYLTNDTSITLVTSQRQLIDENGRKLNSIKASKRLYKKDTLIEGICLGNIMLKNINNYIGEPTTVLFRRNCLDEPFGVYKGKNCLNNVDIPSWLNLLKNGNALYISKPLSYFRIHGNQISANYDVEIRGLSDWIQNVLDSRIDGFLKNEADFLYCLKKLGIRILSIINREKLISSVNKETIEYFYKNMVYLQDYLNSTGKEILTKDEWLQSLIDYLSIIRKENISNSNQDFRKIIIDKLCIQIQDREIYIWGTNQRGLECLLWLNQYDLKKVRGFIGKRTMKRREIFKKIPIVTSSFLKKRFEKRPYIFIDSRHYEEIAAQLASMKYFWEKDYFVY